MRSRSLATGLCLVVVLGLGSPASAEGQSWRIQGAWVAGQVGGGLLGPEFRRAVGAAPPLPLPGAPRGVPVEVPSRDWYLTAMLGVGANWAPPPGSRGRIEPLAYLHGGVLYRTGRPLPSYVGWVAVSYVTVGAVGSALFIEGADVAALQLGLLHSDGAWRGHAAFELGIAVLRDLWGS